MDLIRFSSARLAAKGPLEDLALKMVVRSPQLVVSSKYLGVRDLEKGKQAMKEILEPGSVELLELDMGSVESTRTAAKTFLSKSTQLLANNAVIMVYPEAKIVDGFESQLVINYLGHFRLSKLLEPTLLSSSNSASSTPLPLTNEIER